MTLFTTVLRRDSDYVDNDLYFGPPAFAFLGLLLFTCAITCTLLYLRRCRRLAEQQSLPSFHPSGHHRTLTIRTAPSNSSHGDSVFVYDEKMNLIANSSSPPNSPVPEIRVTFPEDDRKDGQSPAGRVVVLRISDSGSVGMEPLRQPDLPPYQNEDAERFHSLDLERMGGLREKPTSPSRYS